MPRDRYVAISFHEFRSMCLGNGECATVEFILCCSLVCWRLPIARSTFCFDTVKSMILHDQPFAAEARWEDRVSARHVDLFSKIRFSFSGIPRLSNLPRSIEEASGLKKRSRNRLLKPIVIKRVREVAGFTIGSVFKISDCFESPFMISASQRHTEFGAAQLWATSARLFAKRTFSVIT